MSLALARYIFLICVKSHYTGYAQVFLEKYIGLISALGNKILWILWRWRGCFKVQFLKKKNQIDSSAYIITNKTWSFFEVFFMCVWAYLPFFKAFPFKTLNTFFCFLSSQLPYLLKTAPCTIFPCKTTFSQLHAHSQLIHTNDTYKIYIILLKSKSRYTQINLQSRFFVSCLGKPNCWCKIIG